MASRVSDTQGVTMQANQGTLYLSDIKVDSTGNVTLREADVILTSALNSSSQTFEEKTSRSGVTINDVMGSCPPVRNTSPINLNPVFNGIDLLPRR